MFRVIPTNDRVSMCAFIADDVAIRLPQSSMKFRTLIDTTQRLMRFALYSRPNVKANFCILDRECNNRNSILQHNAQLEMTIKIAARDEIVDFVRLVNVCLMIIGYQVIK